MVDLAGTWMVLLLASWCERTARILIVSGTVRGGWILRVVVVVSRSVVGVILTLVALVTVVDWAVGCHEIPVQSFNNLRFGVLVLQRRDLSFVACDTVQPCVMLGVVDEYIEFIWCIERASNVLDKCPELKEILECVEVFYHAVFLLLRVSGD